MIPAHPPGTDPTGPASIAAFPGALPAVALPLPVVPVADGSTGTATGSPLPAETGSAALTIAPPATGSGHGSSIDICALGTNRRHVAGATVALALITAATVGPHSIAIVTPELGIY